MSLIAVVKKSTICLASVLAAGFVVSAIAAVPRQYSDDEIKARYAFISRLIHGDENGGHIRRVLRMSGYDTNRLARVLREIAVEETNETRRALRDLGIYKTSESLPFLYSYATNATYGADALKSVFAIEGVTSNSVSAIGDYLSITNYMPPLADYSRSELCEWLLRKVHSAQELEAFCGPCREMAIGYARDVSTMHKSLDAALIEVDSTYRFSKRRLSVMRSAQNRCWNAMLTNYVANAISELVAYPEANLPD